MCVEHKIWREIFYERDQKRLWFEFSHDIFTGFKMPRFKIGENTPLGKIQHIDLYDKLQTLIFLKDANISRGANRD